MVAAETAIACCAQGKRRKGKKKDDNRPDVCPRPITGTPKCFAAGTLVHTEDGLKPIEQIVPGDLVKSMDTITGEIAYKPVTEIHTNQFDPVGQVTLLDETDGSETVLSVTASHPFYSQNREWVHASKLQVGEKLIEDSGGTLTVTSVEFNPNAKAALTYNLTVGDYHTYFVGEDGVLVHNGRRLGPSGKPLLTFLHFGPRKQALDAAKHAPGSCGVSLHYTPKRGKPHFHSIDKFGSIIKNGIHYVFPK